jgi:hypothetical protein
MSWNHGSTQQSRDSVQQELPADSFPADALPGRWSSRVFYIFSAVLHFAAVVALSSTWMLGTVATSKSASAAPPAPEKPAMARMAIDVGPIKFCEMNIETLVGRPQSPTDR